MALMPDNLELLNNHGFYFEKVENFYEVELPSASNCRLSFYDARQAELSFIIASHCLRTIPEFQEKNPKYTAWMDGDGYRDDIVHYISYLENYENCYDDVNSILNENPPMPKTIAAATLHGQGEFPPSTLEELCKSYENVMSE
jgi:hypothetical protein